MRVSSHNIVWCNVTPSFHPNGFFPIPILTMPNWSRRFCGTFVPCTMPLLCHSLCPFSRALYFLTTKTLPKLRHSQCYSYGTLRPKRSLHGNFYPLTDRNTAAGSLASLKAIPTRLVMARTCWVIAWEFGVHLH